jgi:hypothetical protein
MGIKINPSPEQFISAGTGSRGGAGEGNPFTNTTTIKD